jgi:energy-coupling factor transporter ATP-binding protein EcfA2
MQVRRININNFKSLANFELDLGHFTCLIGLNGSGKSTVLQVIDFISRLFRGNVSSWLTKRQWKAADLTSKLPRKSEYPTVKIRRRFIIDLSLELLGDDAKIHWQCSFNRVNLRCTQESLTIGNVQLLRVDEGHFALFSFSADAKDRMEIAGGKISFAYQGSILSQLKDDILPEPILAFKAFMTSTISLDLLSPHYLRQRTRQSGGEVGLGGERLSAFVHELSGDQRKELEKRLRAFNPTLSRVYTSSLRSGWKQLEIGETFGDHLLWSEARHVNDGLLRLMAILAELLTDSEFLLFEEIENGINPELVEFLLDTLVAAQQQVLVTTHSPMILNYLDDEVARAGVQYLYKTPEGFTRSVPFFAIPSVSEKLEVMGPGEAFVDTNLTRLYEEIVTMPTQTPGQGNADTR